MDPVKESQSQSEPVDSEFFKLFRLAVEHGIKLVRKLESRKVYFWSHLSFHRAYISEGNSIPDFSPDILTNYSNVFGTNTNSPINWKEHAPISNLIAYALSAENIHNYFRSAKYTLAGEDYRIKDEHVELFLVGVYGHVVDMCLHKLAGDEISENWFKPWFREIERGILDPLLEVDLIVPITALSFNFDSRWLDPQNVAIFRMNNEFQEARFLDQQLDIKVPSYVAGFASHAFLLKNRRIANEGYLQTSHAAQKLIENEIPLINALFGLLKAATGHATGYAQVVLNPIMWAHRYLAHLPVVISQSIRAYPTFFDDGIWRYQPDTVDSKHLDSIGEILTDKSTFAKKKMRLAISRLNSCLLRDTSDDKILDACIGLEALFSDDTKQELTHKLALRIAAVSHLFQRGNYIRKEIFKATKTIYRYRSTVAHGGSDTSEDAVVSINGDKLSTENFAVEILRESIIALGRNPQYLRSEIIDFELLLSPAGPISED